jgi:hypothetical protein
MPASQLDFPTLRRGNLSELRKDGQKNSKAEKELTAFRSRARNALKQSMRREPRAEKLLAATNKKVHRRIRVEFKTRIGGKLTDLLKRVSLL